MIDNDLSDCSLADVLERLAAGRVGHRAVMKWLGIESYNELVETMHFNGLIMPGHREMIVTPETQELLQRILRPLPGGTKVAKPRARQGQTRRV